MARNAMAVNLRQSILKSFGRYFAIVLIIALGSALFVGLLMTKSDMVLTGQEFMDDTNMFDLRLIGSYGWSGDQVESAGEIPGVVQAEGVLYLDMIGQLETETSTAVYRFYALPEKLNQVELRGGRMPERPDECLADGFLYGDSILGKAVTLSEANDPDAKEDMVYTTYTVVGYVSSPLYMDMNRGTTSVGSGSLTSFFYVPADAFSVDYFTELHLDLAGEHTVYSEEYKEFLDSETDRLEPYAEQLAESRFQQIADEAESAYQAGYEEYLLGVDAFITGKRTFDKAIIDAEKKLLDGEEEIETTRRKLNRTYEMLQDSELQIRNGLSTLDSKKAELEQQRASCEAQLADVSNNQIPAAQAALNGAAQGSMTDEEFAAYKTQLQGNLNGLYAMQAGLQNAISVSIPSGFQQIEDKRSELTTGLYEVAAGYGQVRYGWSELEKAVAELEDAWAEFEEAKAEGQEEIRDARIELLDSFDDLKEAREEIDDLEYTDPILLDRTSNAGYNSLDSTSDIVQGVSRVIPVFFLLVAALVCITTMTRMIDEERTQIGTLKALGYSNGAIISKYLVYAGSGAVIGCGLGVWAGSAIFPGILWQAYQIMLYIREDMVISFNLWLCGIVVVTYTAIMLFVTWYCCRKTLKEVPAELIRPKAPDPGKKLLVEYLPLWRRLSFLNKVMFRNIFRYRQRLAMMMVGIGGCTALLLTGFGLRDSIIGIVDYQYENVTVYDLEIYFSEEQSQTQQNDIRSKIGDQAEDMIFLHQSSIELEFDGVTKEIYILSGDEGVTDYIDMEYGGAVVAMPGQDQIVLSAGVVDALGIHTGDMVTVRNADMQSMELVVSGVYENHVYNYGIILPETIESNWGELPEIQMSYLKIAEGIEPFALSAQISDIDDVMTVIVSEDVAASVGTMMEALDLVVWVIVFCAGLLAAIVLYNLTNININERIREIATIKVLGFNAKETASYVFKENLTLTVAGSLFGLLLGELLLMFVMTQVKIDMVWFKTIIEPVSYILSVMLTMVAAFVVDFLFYFKLDKINMAEALKSVE